MSTLTIATEKGPIKLIAPFSLKKDQKDVLKKIISNLVESDDEYVAADEFKQELKSELPDIDSPGSNLRSWMSIKDISQKELSKKAKISQPALSEMMHDKRVITITSAKRLAKAMGINYKLLV